MNPEAVVVTIDGVSEGQVGVSESLALLQIKEHSKKLNLGRKFHIIIRIRKFHIIIITG